MKLRKRMLLLTLAAMLLCTAMLPLSSPAESEKATLRVSWWGGDSRHAALLSIIDAFTAANPDIVIEPEYSAFAQYRDKFNIQLTSHASADVMAVDQPWVARLVKEGDYFLDLNEYAEILQLDSFDSFLMDNYCCFDGRTLFVPAGINGMGSLVDANALIPFGFDPNAETFTWDQLIALGEKVHEADNADYLCCVDSKQAALYYMRVYLRQLTGTQLINDDGTLGCTKEELAQALGLVDTLYKKSIFQPIAEHAVYNNSMTQNPAWIDRHMFMILGRTSVMTDMSARLPKEDGSYTTQGFVMPIMENAKESGIEVRPSTMFAISKDCKYPEAAVKFLSFLFTDPTAVEMMKANYSIPAREESRTIANEKNLLDPSALANAEYSLENAGNLLNSWSSNSEVEAMFTEIMEKIAYGQYADMNEAADEVIERIENIVDSNS